jgi:ankyrin repeat protein
LHFHANVKATVATGGVVELEPEAEEAAVTASGAGGDEHARKVALGKLGHEYTEDSFVHAVADGNLEAIRLFMKIGMSPNAHAKADQHPMLFAASLCGHPGGKGNRSDLLEALVAAGGDVKVKDDNASTPLLWAAQTGCSASAIRALLKAGADPNARAKGSATPLMFAEIFQRTEIAEILRNAGAKK